MTIHSTRRRHPKRERLPKLKLGDQQTRRVMFDASQDAKATFWCRNQRGKRCTLGGCGDCATEIDGQLSLTMRASVWSKKDDGWMDVQWNLSATTMDTLCEAIPEGAGMVEIALTRDGEGFETTYSVELIAADDVQDVDPDEIPDDIR